MSSASFLRALGAAQRVAFLGLVGCAASHARPGAAPERDAGATSLDATLAAADGDCLTDLETFVEADGGSPPSTAEHVACCIDAHEHRQAATHLPPGEEARFEALCCRHPALDAVQDRWRWCFAWGPPMPPSTAV